MTVSHLRFGPHEIAAPYLVQQADYLAVNHQVGGWGGWRLVGWWVAPVAGACGAVVCVICVMCVVGLCATPEPGAARNTHVPCVTALPSPSLTCCTPTHPPTCARPPLPACARPPLQSYMNKYDTLASLRPGGVVVINTTFSNIDSLDKYL